jgi:hypothetical protein
MLMSKVSFRRFGFVFVASSVLIPAMAWAQLPIKHATPGKASKVTKEEVCAASFESKPVSDRQAAEALEGYGLRADSGRKVVQLIPSSLGGTTDKENLWPLPDSKEFGPAQKKALDDRLHSMVCAGTIDLKVAQDALKKDWTEAYKKYVTQ